ncbi:unnamed protein product [Lampetra planeri]
MMGEHAEGSHVCTAYETATHDSMSAFLCPRTGDPSEWTYCCGFSDNKHCCETPDQYFPYRGGYMWSLSVGALVGLGIAGLILIAFVLCAFVLCYFSLFTKPAQRLPSGLRLQPLAGPPSARGLRRSVTRTARPGERVVAHHAAPDLRDPPHFRVAPRGAENPARVVRPEPPCPGVPFPWAVPTKRTCPGIPSPRAIPQQPPNSGVPSPWAIPPKPLSQGVSPPRAIT